MCIGLKQKIFSVVSNQTSISFFFSKELGKILAKCTQGENFYNHPIQDPFYCFVSTTFTVLCPTVPCSNWVCIKMVTVMIATTLVFSTNYTQALSLSLQLFKFTILNRVFFTIVAQLWLILFLPGTDKYVQMLELDKHVPFALSFLLPWNHFSLSGSVLLILGNQGHS